MNALTLSATRRRKPIVILSSSVIAWTKNNCTPMRLNMAASVAAGIAGAVGFIIDNGTLVAAAAIVATATIFLGSSLAQEKPQNKKGGTK